MDADQILAFRLARSGLAARSARSLADAAVCPASDFQRDAALLALAARTDALDRETYDRAVDRGDVVVAYIVRGAIHALAPGDLALYGRALIMENKFRASRYGLDGMLIDFGKENEVRARDLMRDLQTEGEWPFVAGRFVRPEAVVSIDLEIVSR